jgi:hypothetical protein
MALRAVGRGRPARRPPPAAALLAAALLPALLAAAPAAAQAALDCASLGAGAAPAFAGCQVLKPGVAALLWRFDRKPTTICYRIVVKPQPSDNLGWFAVGQSDLVGGCGRLRARRAMRGAAARRWRRAPRPPARSATGRRHGGREQERALLRGPRLGAWVWAGGRRGSRAVGGPAVGANTLSAHCPHLPRPLLPPLPLPTGEHERCGPGAGGTERRPECWRAAADTMRHCPRRRHFSISSAGRAQRQQLAAGCLLAAAPHAHPAGPTLPAGLTP